MKQTRVRCPLCGYMAYERNFDKDNLVRLEVFTHKFGGRYPNSKRGISEFTKIKSPTVLGFLRKKIILRLEKVANFFGYILESVSTSPSVVVGVIPVGRTWVIPKGVSEVGPISEIQTYPDVR